jgi:hypothetical protein
MSPFRLARPWPYGETSRGGMTEVVYLFPRIIISHSQTATPRHGKKKER